MDEEWETVFGWYDEFACQFCSERLERSWESRKARSPDYNVPILFTSTGACCVEFQFVDPKDGMSEWTYWFWCYVSLEERKKYGSNV